MKRLILIIPILLVVLSACGKDPEITELDYFYFDTSMSIKIYDDAKDLDIDTIDSEIDNLLNRMENDYSPNISDSMISKVNDRSEMTVSDEFIDVLNKSIEACNMTDGKYDPSSGALINLWSINNANHIPTDDEITEAMNNIGCNDIQIDGNTISMPEGYLLDFGSSVKGYAADLIAGILTDNDVSNAMINLGGNIQAVGNKYGNPFNIGIMTPETDNITNENVLTMQVEDTAVVTSGINQRFFEQDGNIYHHIIDATVGAPADNGLASVSIVTANGSDADILSTMTFLLGLEDGYNFIENLDGVEAIFITRDKKIYETTDLNITLADDTYTIETMD